MATSHLPINTGSGATTSGKELIYNLEALGSAFQNLERIFDAMEQQKDGTANDKTDHVTQARVFGYKSQSDGTTADDGTVAKASFDEINSMLGTCRTSLLQCVAKHKQ